MKDLLSKEYRHFLMGIAIILITLHHLAIYGAGFPFCYFRKGNIGVDIFFFLSVYGCCFAFDDNSILTFYWRRIKRLFPIYLVFLSIFILFFRLDYGWQYNLKMVLSQISGLSVFGLNEIVAWYIPSTFLIYITFPISFAFFRLVKPSIAVQIIFLVCIMLITPKLPILVNTALAMRIPIICLGFMTYFNKGNDAYLIMLYIIAVTFGYFIPNLYVESVTIPLIFYILGKSDVRIYNNFVAFLGRHSLEIYLSQYIAIGMLFANRQYSFLSDNLYIQLICAMLMLCILTTIMFASHSVFWKLVR